MIIRVSICKKTLYFSSRPNTQEEDSWFKRGFAEGIPQSNELFAKSSEELSRWTSAMVSAITKSVQIFSQALSNQNQQASPPYIYQSLPDIHLQTQHSLMQFPQPQRNVAQFQPYSLSSVPNSANSQGQEFAILLNSEFRRDDKKY